MSTSNPAPARARSIRVSAAVIVNDRDELLLVRKTGTTAFMQPGGKPEPDETPAETLSRELSEELGLSVDAADLRSLGLFTAAAANEPGFVVVADVFEADIGDVLTSDLAGRGRRLVIRGVVESFPSTDPAVPLVVLWQGRVARRCAGGS